jgi:segregation and condensation protein A|tara:strand:- start:9 stop:749 length:741 start_codon:yes stop_codon:yes gene_type:complete
MHLNDSNSLSLKILNYSGPLDTLLELAKSQKVDLNKISVTELADQFHNFITKTTKLNLNLASEYLLMATWLTYLKSKLLLPETDEEEFKALEVASKLKMQLKKLELIRLLSDQMLKRKRIGVDVFFRGVKGGIRSIYNTKYSTTLYEIIKSYSSIVMRKDYQKINIPKLPIFSTEEGITRIKSILTSLIDWKDMNKLIPKTFLSTKKLKKTGTAGIFSGSLELVKEGDLIMKQSKLFDKIYIKQKI